MANIAIFDLDYTLTKRGTWGRFVIKNVKFKPWLWLPLTISAGVTQWRYKQGHLPRIRVRDRQWIAPRCHKGTPAAPR